MAYITIKQFAKKHKVTRQAIEYLILKKRLKVVKQFGINLVNEKEKYKKIRKK